MFVISNFTHSNTSVYFRKLCFSRGENMRIITDYANNVRRNSGMYFIANNNIIKHIFLKNIISSNIKLRPIFCAI